MAICTLGCNPTESKLVHEFEDFDERDIQEARFPITSTTQELDLLIVGASVENLTRLCATISDWNVPPVTLLILDSEDFDTRVDRLSHHPRVGRTIFFCKSDAASIRAGLSEVYAFFCKRKSLNIDNKISGNYTINNVSPRWLFQTMMEHLDEYIYFKDRDSKFLAVSRYLAQSCDKDSASEVLGLSDFDLFDSRHAEEAYTDERKIATGLLQELYKEERIMKNGAHAWVSSRKLPLHTRSNFLAGSFGLSRDITESKLLTQQLEQNHERMQAELILARNLQSTLINQGLPEYLDSTGCGRLEIATRYVPSSHLSGDFFAVQKPADNGCAILVADVMGHGVRAAMVTAMIQIAVQQLRAYANQPAEFMKRLNNMMQRSMEPTGQMIFATAIYCYLDIDTRQLTYTQAGARHGIYAPAGDAESALLFENRTMSPAIGLLPDSEYAESQIELNPNDEVLLYTDGIIEAAMDDEEYSEERLVQFLMAHRRDRLPDMMDGLLASVQEFTMSKDLEDDVCLVALRLP